MQDVGVGSSKGGKMLGELILDLALLLLLQNLIFHPIPICLSKFDSSVLSLAFKIFRKQETEDVNAFIQSDPSLVIPLFLIVDSVLPPVANPKETERFVSGSV